MNQGRPRDYQGLGQGLGQSGERVAGGGATIAAGDRHAGEIHVRRDGGLATGGIVNPIVEQDVDQILRPLGADGAERAQLHQRGAVAIENDHRPRHVQGHAEPHGAGTAHGADLIEMLGPVAEGKQLAAAFPRRCDHRRLVGGELENFLQRGEPRRPCAAFVQVPVLSHRPGGTRRRFPGRFGDSALAQDQGVRTTGPVHGRNGLI